MAIDTVSRESTNGSGKRAKANGAAVPPVDARPASVELDKIDIARNVRVDVAGVDELAASITEVGVLQPVKVRPTADGRFALQWGQRRVLAARLAGLTRIPVIYDDEAEKAPERLSIEQLVENLHRADLNPIDRAQAMRQVVDAGMSQADLARTLGLHPSTIANDLGILEAPPKVRALIEQGEISPAHQRALKGLAPKSQADLASKAAKEGWSAHRTEQEVQEAKRAADREREQRERNEQQAAATLAQLEASIASQSAEKKVPTDALILVENGYGGDAARLVALLKKAGFKNARATTSWNEIQPRPTGGACDCTAWKAAEHTNYDYGKQVGGRYVQVSRASFTKGCIVRKHQQAKEAAAEDVRRAKAAIEEKVREHVRENAEAWPISGFQTADIVPLHEARAIAIQRILAEAALWSLLSYGKATWAEARGGKRSDPWPVIHRLSDQDLAAELAKAIAGDFRDHDGVRVGWAGLAAELGLLEEPVETPAKKGKKQASAAPVDTRPVPELGDPVISQGGAVGIGDGQLFRIRAIGLHAIQLAEAQPGWQTADVHALVDPGRLSYDKPDGVWRGPVVPSDGILDAPPADVPEEVAP